MNKFFYYIITSCLVLCSCGDFLEYKDKDKIIPKELKHFDELIYGELLKKTNGDEMIALQFMTDELMSVVKPISSGSRSDSRRDYMSYFTWAPNNQLDQDGKEKNDITWGEFYHKILMCNTIESEVSGLENDTDGMKTRLLGEVCFIRAMSYFYLVNMYGEPYESQEQAKNALGVPINTAISVETKTYTRAKLQEVYDLIEKDLLKAVDLLKTGEQSNTKFRPNVHVVKLFLSRIYLYQKQWDKALKACNELIEGSTATIDVIARMETYPKERRPFYNSGNTGILYSWGIRNTIPYEYSSDAGHWEVNSELKQMYVSGDVRSKAFFETFFPYIPKKYNKSGRTCYDWSYRIEEAYLNRAEACIGLGGKANIEQAMADINVIRENRITGDYTVNADNVEDATRLLRDEKRMEFCFEDTRWFDIRRWAIEITHKVHRLNAPESYDTYVLKGGSPNYILSVPLEVQKVNDKIEQFEREETLVSK